MQNPDQREPEGQSSEYLKFDDFLELNPEFDLPSDEDNFRKILEVYHFTPEILKSIVREFPYGVALHGTNYEVASKIEKEGLKRGNFVSIPKENQRYLDDATKGKILLLNLFHRIHNIVVEGIDCQPYRFGGKDIPARKYGDIPKDSKNYPAAVIFKGRKDVQFFDHDSSTGSPERSPYKFHYFVPKGGLPSDVCDAIICPSEEEIKEIGQKLADKFGGGFELLDYEPNTSGHEINEKALREYNVMITEILQRKITEYFVSKADTKR